jgi:hypothetical protein
VFNDNQHIQFVYVRLVSGRYERTTTCLGGAGKPSGSSLLLATCEPAATGQRWRLQWEGATNYRIRSNVNPNMCVYDAGHGVPVRIEPCNASHPWQVWSFE